MTRHLDMHDAGNMAFPMLIALCFICKLAAIMLTSAYYASDATFSYKEPIQWHQLLLGLPKIDAASVKSATQCDDWFVMGASVIGFVLVLWSADKVKSISRFVFFLVQPLVFLNGWVGIVLLFMFPFELIHLDGEWIGEHSPTLMSTGCWLIVSGIIAFRSCPWRKK